MWKKLKWTLALAGASAALVYWGCGLDEADRPDLAGPSELAQSVEMRAVPDQLVADGQSSSVIEAVYRDEKGNRTAGKNILFDLGVQGQVSVFGGNFSDIGNLSPLDGVRPTWGGTEAKAESAITDSGGVARVRYWSPFRSNQVNDIAVTITARPEGTDYRAALYRQVDIYLRAADRPLFPGGSVCDIVVEPLQSAYAVGQDIFFTAAQSVGENGLPIARYEWDFGDGPPRVTERHTGHAYSAPGRYTVTLYTTESQTGVQDQCEVIVDVTWTGGPAPPSTTTSTSTFCATPTASFTVLGACASDPTVIVSGTTVVFDGSGSNAGASESIFAYDWYFSDNTTGMGVVVTKTVTTDLTVVLAVENTCGNIDTTSRQFTVGPCP